MTCGGMGERGGECMIDPRRLEWTFGYERSTRTKTLCSLKLMFILTHSDLCSLYFTLSKIFHEKYFNLLPSLQFCPN